MASVSRTWPALVVSALLIASSCSSAVSTSEPESPPDSSTATTTLDGSAETAMPEQPATSSADLQTAFDEWSTGADGGGVAAVRVGGGELITLAAGHDATTGEPLDVNVPVRVGSVSKPFVATMVLQMVEEGSLSLDEELSTYLPNTRHGAEVTVRQLLSHQTGIADYTENPAFFEAALAQSDRSVTPPDILTFADADEVAFEPGSEFAYSNTNYILLGQLIEVVSGTDLNSQLETRITQPLGLGNTSFDDGSRTDVASGFTVVYPSGDTGSQSYTSVATGAWAAGALVSTPGDLAVFLDALMTGELISEASFEQMRDGVNTQEDYGLGLHSGDAFGLGHGGGILGFITMMQRNPDTGDLLIVVVNNDLRRADIAGDVLWEAATASG